MDIKGFKQFYKSMELLAEFALNTQPNNRNKEYMKKLTYLS